MSAVSIAALATATAAPAASAFAFAEVQVVNAASTSCCAATPSFTSCLVRS